MHPPLAAVRTRAVPRDDREPTSIRLRNSDDIWKTDRSPDAPQSTPLHLLGRSEWLVQQVTKTHHQPKSTSAEEVHRELHGQNQSAHTNSPEVELKQPFPKPSIPARNPSRHLRNDPRPHRSSFHLPTDRTCGQIHADPIRHLNGIRFARPGLVVVRTKSFGRFAGGGRVPRRMSPPIEIPSLRDRFEVAFPPTFWRGNRVVVAVSGGADSISLLRLMDATGFLPPGELRAAHFHHGLRPSAEEDADFVSKTCRELQIPCQIGYWRANRPSTLGEAAARQARYAFLQSASEKVGARYLLIAHSAEDQAETILHQVLRGSGLRGLSGIPQTRNLTASLTLLRPLLAFRRQELRDYLESLRQSFREDPSNASPQFTRNRIRHQLLPLANSLLPNDIVESLCRLGRIADESQSAMESQAAKLLAQAVATEQSSASFTIDRSLLRASPPAVVRELLVLAWKQLEWPRGSMGFEQWEGLRKILVAQEDRSTTLPGAIAVIARGDRAWVAASGPANRVVP